jgi:type III pantothenate kinase
MFVAIDAGNTNVHLGIADDESKAWNHLLRFSSNAQRTADEWFSLLGPTLDDRAKSRPRIVLSSVVPAMTTHFRDLAEQRLVEAPIEVGPSLDLGVEICTDRPEETGPDRLANAAAASALFGRPAIIVDLGTATKVDVVDCHGRFLGGAIAPGITIGMEAIAERAARLYAVPLRFPRTAIGNNTSSAVQAGVVLGHLKMIEGLVSSISEELGSVSHVVLTGGNGQLVAGKSPLFTAYEPNLTLEGLRIVSLRNP